jgi:hypothetical protein
MQVQLPIDKEVTMTRISTALFAAIAALSTASACAAEVNPTINAAPAPTVTQQLPSTEELTGNPGKFLRFGPQADDMGYVFAAVYNPNDFPLANVYVKVVHFNAETRQPDGGSNDLLVAEKLGPKEGARVKLEGAQVYKQEDLNRYRVLVVHVELGTPQ